MIIPLQLLPDPSYLPNQLNSTPFFLSLYKTNRQKPNKTQETHTRLKTTHPSYWHSLSEDEMTRIQGKNLLVQSSFGCWARPLEQPAAEVPVGTEPSHNHHLWITDLPWRSGWVKESWGRITLLQGSYHRELGILGLSKVPCSFASFSKTFLETVFLYTQDWCFSHLQMLINATNYLQWFVKM